MSEFVHLHNHSHYSLLDGLATPIGFVKKAKEQGSNAVALTDHGTMYGAIEFYKAAKKEDINPIIGCEYYVAIRTRHNKDAHVDNKRFHLILLARNNEGYRNLLELTTKAYLEGMYYKPRIDFELLEQYNKGLICSSACLQGHIPRALMSGDEQKARDYINRFQKIYGKENFFLEIQHHPSLSEQAPINDQIITLSKELNVPLIATNDVHYINKDDAEAHDVMICIQTNAKVQDQNRMTMISEDYSMRDPQEMKDAFSAVPESITNTQEIADRCQVEFSFGNYLIPSFDIPKNYTDPKDYLRELCLKGCIKNYQMTISFDNLLESKTEQIPDSEKEIIKRLDYELKIIHQMGFDKYFLIVWDFVNFAKNEGIMVGPGRGSAAGSIVAYSLGITDLDPLKYQLLFERFLNPERVSMPDIDIDFADNRRDEVIAYVTRRYGDDHVAQISTFGTMAARAAVKDVGRTMGVPFSEMNNLAKLIPERPGTKLKEALESENELKEAYDTNPLYKKIIDIALKLEGTVRHISVHACAVVISPEPLVKYSAFQHPPKDDKTIITQYSAKPLEALGLLKMDFLGLKNLTIIQRTINIIKRIQGHKIDIRTIPIDDKKTYELFARGETTGVFQFESGGMRRYLRELKPTEFEDIIAMVALYRPGPMDWIPDYMKGKHGKKLVHYIHPSLEPFLKKTYGIAIYQEQILEIARYFAGFSLGEADILRRAIGKKIISELISQKEKFIQGAINQGHDKETAIIIFEKVIEPFAGYGFNKSHAAGYSLISYQTAYLKANYLTEFMTATMSCDADNMDRIVREIEECRLLGIEVLPPDINESFTSFTVVKNKKIRFGLSAIKGLGDGPIQSILKSRGIDEIKFSSLEDFVKRVDTKVINKKTFEALAKSGALDSLGERNALLLNFEKIVAFSKEAECKQSNGQIDLFDLMGDGNQQALILDSVKKASFFQKLFWEKELMGMYITAHPLAGLNKYLSKKMDPIGSINKKSIGKVVSVGGLVTFRKKIRTKKGDDMMILELTDTSEKIGVVFFPKTYQKMILACQTDEFLRVTGKVDVRNDEYQIIANEAHISNFEIMRQSAKDENLFEENEKGFDFYYKNQDEDTLNEKVDVVPANTLINSQDLKKSTVSSDFKIIIPITSKRDVLLKLKDLLGQYGGESTVELFLEKEQQTIKIPLKITVNEELKGKIKELLG